MEEEEGDTSGALIGGARILRSEVPALVWRATTTVDNVICTISNHRMGQQFDGQKARERRVMMASNRSDQEKKVCSNSTRLRCISALTPCNTTTKESRKVYRMLHIKRHVAPIPDARQTIFAVIFRSSLCYPKKEPR